MAVISNYAFERTVGLHLAAPQAQENSAPAALDLAQRAAAQRER